MSSSTEGPRVTRATAKPQGRGLNPMFIGIIIGLLLGMLIALTVAYVVSKNSGTANVADKVKQPEPLAKAALPSGVSTPSQRVAAPALKTGEAPKDGAKPRFEFYDILPGDKSSNATKAPAAPAVSTAPVVAPKLVVGPASAQPVNGRPVAAPASANDALASNTGANYVLQAGAFQNESDAESLKAKIAFAGYEATVRPVNLPDKGTLYRVRLGTYRNIDEVNRVRTALAQNGITASVVKVE